MTTIVCFATLLMSATAPAQTFDGSLRRQAVEPSPQRTSSEINWRTLPRNSSTDRSPSERSLSERSLSDTTARILIDETSNTVDLRNSPNQPIDHPRQQTGNPSQIFNRSHQPKPEPAAVRLASYEANALPKVGAIPTNNRMVPPAHRFVEPEAAAIAANTTPQPSDMAPIANAFESIRSEQPWPHHQQATVAPQADPSNRQVESDREPRSPETVKDDPDRATANSPASKGFPELSDSSNRQMIEKIAYNTLFVLAFGVGFVFIAKVWIKPGAAQNATSQDGIEVISSLKLPAKSNLMLVNVGGEKLLVALDASGVKSVVHLTDSFANKLAAYSEIEDEVSVTEQRFEESSVSTATTTAKPKSKSKSPVYTLDSMLGERAKNQTVKEDNAEKNEDAIRAQMEAALLKFGLKGLV